ncbi:MAG: SPOR domain-containing protein [Sphingomonadaceae bacterium]|jgi:rare lipoprotein A|nr:SPOR domain-containing protein [Sphingomonadaceae bacterium]
MRLPVDLSKRLALLGLSLAVAACGRGGTDFADLPSASVPQVASATNGPEADFPIVLGEPYTVDGQTYTPFDTLNHDEVGYATFDREGGASISAAHKTLPLPSYVEVTALDTGKTVLVRVERRGPMTAGRVIALSQGATASLGIGEGAPVRVRRVNPPEDDRAMLRTGVSAPERMETPNSLLTVLRRKLPSSGSANLAAASPQRSTAELPPVASSGNVGAATPVAVARVQTPRSTAAQSFDQVFSQDRKAVTAYPLPPLNAARQAVRPAVASSQPAVSRSSPAPQRVVQPSNANDGRFVVQAAAFSQKSNATRAADAVGGFVEQSGRFYRVRMGPFASRGQAEAALAKARAAGYSDARVYPTG